MEQCQNNTWYPIAFASKMFSSPEQKYPTHDQEMLGIMHALREWRSILISNPHPIQIFTDHIGLKFFKEPQNLSYRHIQWSIELANFHMTIAYVKGSHNIITDALSWSPILELELLKQDKIITLLPKDIWLPDFSSEKLA